MKRVVFSSLFFLVFGSVATYFFTKWVYGKTLYVTSQMSQESHISSSLTYIELLDQGELSSLRSILISSLPCSIYLYDQEVIDKNYEETNFYKKLKPQALTLLDGRTCDVTSNE